MQLRRSDETSYFTIAANISRCAKGSRRHPPILVSQSLICFILGNNVACGGRQRQAQNDGYILQPNRITFMSMCAYMRMQDCVKTSVRRERNEMLFLKILPQRRRTKEAARKVILQRRNLHGLLEIQGAATRWKRPCCTRI